MTKDEYPYILYAEDDPDDAFFMQRALEKTKLPEKVVIVTDGSDVISHFLEKPKTAPKFVLLDIKMPKISGLEALVWLRANVAAHLPIFMLSSSSQERDLQQSQQSGANGYLLKPSNATQLGELLKSIVEYCGSSERLVNSWAHFDGEKFVVRKRS